MHLRRERTWKWKDDLVQKPHLSLAKRQAKYSKSSQRISDCSARAADVKHVMKTYGQGSEGVAYSKCDGA